jgi:hypothetical protein
MVEAGLQKVVAQRGLQVKSPTPLPSRRGAPRLAPCRTASEPVRPRSPRASPRRPPRQLPRPAARCHFIFSAAGRRLTAPHRLFI